MTEIVGCPLGLENNCIIVEPFEPDGKPECINRSYCLIAITAWTIPYKYEKIDGVPCLTVIAVHLDLGFPWGGQEEDFPQNEATRYGWQSAQLY